MATNSVGISQSYRSYNNNTPAHMIFLLFW